MVATGRYVGGRPGRGRSRSVRDRWPSRRTPLRQRCGAVERLTVVDGIDEGYPDTCSDGEGGVAVADGNGCRAVQLVDVTIKVLPVYDAKSSTGNSSPASRAMTSCPLSVSRVRMAAVVSTADLTRSHRPVSIEWLLW